MSGLAQHFDLTNGINILRLICGLFFIPHIVGKFTEPATLNFFKAAKFTSAGDLDVCRRHRSRLPHHRSGLRHLHALCRLRSAASICWSPAGDV